MKLINPIDISEAKVDFSKVAPNVSGTYTNNTGKRTDKDIDSSVALKTGKAVKQFGR
jgi:hypothetical protein